MGGGRRPRPFPGLQYIPFPLALTDDVRTGNSTFNSVSVVMHSVFPQRAFLCVVAWLLPLPTGAVRSSSRLLSFISVASGHKENTPAVALLNEMKCRLLLLFLGSAMAFSPPSCSLSSPPSFSPIKETFHQVLFRLRRGIFRSESESHGKKKKKRKVFPFPLLPSRGMQAECQSRGRGKQQLPKKEENFIHIFHPLSCELCF